jgi:hypothetical protein
MAGGSGPDRRGNRRERQYFAAEAGAPGGWPRPSTSRAPVPTGLQGGRRHRRPERAC